MKDKVVGGRMIAIVDYGMSNLRSVRHALQYLGAEAEIIDSPAQLSGARAIVLPGDGAFGPAMENLRDRGWLDPLHSAVTGGIPFLGICLGMQLLFDSSEEGGEHPGLGILRGRVRRFPPGTNKVPQIGWNQLQIRRGSQLLEGVCDGAFAYFVHSYFCEAASESVVTAYTTYGVPYASVVESGNVWGVQFHPEKSGADGLRMLQNFVSL